MRFFLGFGAGVCAVFIFQVVLETCDQLIKLEEEFTDL